LFEWKRTLSEEMSPMGKFAGIEGTPTGSSENPFGITSDSGHFYSNPAYEAVCNTILSGIRERRGLIVITGEPGTGKTTIVHQAIDRLDKGTCSVLFCSFHPGLDQTVNSLCKHLGLDIAHREQQQKVQQLNQALLARFWSGKSTAFVVDDAHTLDARTLVQVLSLVDLTLTGEHLLQVVLVGCPELDAKLHSAFCQPLLPTGFPSSEVRALLPAEIAPFIEQQLRAAPDAPHRFFTPEAIHLIAAYSKGIPREIHTLCGLAWVIADLESSPTITAEMVEEIKGERVLWGVGIDAETAPAGAHTSSPDAMPASATPGTSVEPSVDPSGQQFAEVSDGNAEETGKDQEPDLPPALWLDEHAAFPNDTPPSTMPPRGGEKKPTERRHAAYSNWWPSWKLTGSALAAVVLLATGVVLWDQLPFSGESAPPNATTQAQTSSSKDSPEAAAEFAQMQPVITQETGSPEPSTQEALETGEQQRTADASRAAPRSVSPANSPASSALRGAPAAQGESVHGPTANTGLNDEELGETAASASDGPEEAPAPSEPDAQIGEDIAVVASPPPISGPVARPQSEHVARAQFASGIEDREPIDRVGPVVYSNGKHLRRLYYFSEVKGLQGQEITHRWEHEGETLAEVSFPIGGNRWRVYSSKRLIPPMAGDWRVVVSSEGEALHVDHFTYVLGTAPTKATD
jgi:type II secretory pathway predicted ATPase ExeA